MSDTHSPEQSAAFCADLVRSHDFPRYASTLFLPSVHRRPLLALYAFNVEISRVRDQVSQPLPGEMRLQWWIDMLLGQDHGGVEGNPVAAELLWAIRTWRLPVDRLVRLVEEHEFDLYNDPMPSLAALEGYANDTASTLFACGARFLLRPSEAIDHLARHAGLAYGMVQAISALPHGHGAAAIIRAVAVPARPRQRPRRGLCRQADAGIARGDRSTDRRGKKAPATRR